jgi:hypothetical protein
MVIPCLHEGDRAGTSGITRNTTHFWCPWQELMARDWRSPQTPRMSVTAGVWVDKAAMLVTLS